MTPNKHLTKAKALLSLKSVLYLGGKAIKLVAVLDNEPTFSADWHVGKDMHLIAVDENGHFFFRMSSGMVAYWQHDTKTLEVITPSIKAFVALLKEG